jgi:tetratricopeptide (TPR) repeat protein
MKLGTRTWPALTVCVGALMLDFAVLIAGSVISPSQHPSAPSQPELNAQPPVQRNMLTLEERADIFMARKNYGDAIDQYYRALKQSNFSNATIWNKLGIAYQEELNYRGARKAYNEAIHRKKDFAEPWNNLGTTFFMQNKFRKSLKYYKRALELNPDSASFHLNLGTSYFHMKKIKQSVDEYRAALILDPNIFGERSLVGSVMQTRSTAPEFYFYLAKVFASLGRAEEAVRYLKRAFEDGFQDDKKVAEDPDLMKISQHPAFIQLMRDRPVPIKD